MTIQSLETEMEKLSEDLYRQGLFDGHHYEPIEWDTKLDDLFVKSATQALLKTVDLYVKELIGENESLASQSEYDKQHFGHPETDAIVNLHYVRQATRNQFREALRQQVKEDINK